MVELAEIFRQHGGQYQRKYGGRMLPTHLRAMRDIQRCRTEALGGQVYYCKKCDQQRYSYHSCKNRHCPKCQSDQANEWLQQQKDILLPAISTARASGKIRQGPLLRIAEPFE